MPEMPDVRFLSEANTKQAWQNTKKEVIYPFIDSIRISNAGSAAGFIDQELKIRPRKPYNWLTLCSRNNSSQVRPQWPQADSVQTKSAKTEVRSERCWRDVIGRAALSQAEMKTRYLWFTHFHSGLKGIPEKNVSKDLSMNSISKLYFDLNKLRPKIWELSLFETPNFYYSSAKGKLANN